MYPTFFLSFFLYLFIFRLLPFPSFIPILGLFAYLFLLSLLSLHFFCSFLPHELSWLSVYRSHVFSNSFFHFLFKTSKLPHFSVWGPKHLKAKGPPCISESRITLQTFYAIFKFWIKILDKCNRRLVFKCERDFFACLVLLSVLIFVVRALFTTVV